MNTSKPSTNAEGTAVAPSVCQVLDHNERSISSTSVRSTQPLNLLSLPLTLTEIYSSIQGESSFSGKLCTFVRLTGCPLRCRWCDTVYGFEGGSVRTIADALEQIEKLQIDLVEITGGEPLAQPHCLVLMQELCNRGYQVLLETSGSEDISTVDERVHIIMDLKCPDSKMSHKNRYENLSVLKPTDEIKFVLANRCDFDWALSIIEKYELDGKNPLLFSCAFGLLDPKDLAAWMIESRTSARLNMQLHKYIWHPRKRGV